MARPRLTSARVATQARLLEAAEEVFGRLGFVAARLEDIANTVGITRPSLLYHFKSKDRLYTEVVGRAFTMLRNALKNAASATGTFEELLDRILEAYLEFLATHPGLASVLLREILEGRSRGTRLMLRELVPLLSWLENTLTERGAGVIRSDLPIRAAILQIGTACLVRTTAPQALHATLWGPKDHTKKLARMLFIGPKE